MYIHVRILAALTAMKSKTDIASIAMGVTGAIFTALRIH